ncbi:MAG: helical backbone metal receptor [Actinomycetes bacterium]
MKKSLVAVATICALALTACGSNNIPVTPATSAAAASYPITVSNNSADVTFNSAPVSIISLSPTATEMLFAIGAGHQVIAVDDQSTYPASAPISSLSGFTPNLEAIVSMRPDLVVVSNDIDNIVSSLRTAKIPVLVEPAATTLADAYAQIRELGLVTDHAAEADSLATEMKSKIDAQIASISPAAKGLTFYHELDNTMYTVTSTTFIGSIYALAGLVNIADKSPDASSGYPQLSAEFIVKSSPDLIFLADNKCCSVTAAELAKRPGMSALKALTNDNVNMIDDDISSRWGPRTVDLVTAIVAAVNKAAGK